MRLLNPEALAQPKCQFLSHARYNWAGARNELWKKSIKVLAFLSDLFFRMKLHLTARVAAICCRLVEYDAKKAATTLAVTALTKETPEEGFEPTTNGLTVHCSTAELFRIGKEELY